MSEPKDELDKIKKEMKRKKKLAVPEEFLDNAKSYEDKQMLIQVLTEKEKQRVVLMVKNMLKDAVAKKDKK
jgi:NCAIR mutase (PurE)-related protein